METSEAILRKEAAIAMGNKPKVFDWDKAAKILKERNPVYATAGLAEDYEYTSGTIWRDGEPVFDSYTYLYSRWATPVLILPDGEEIDCYVYAEDKPNWSAETKWPESAMRILRGETKE